MTAQIPDTVKYKGVGYNLSRIENHESFFNPCDLGFCPKSNCTANWSGFMATYAVDEDDNLTLVNLSINNNGWEEEEKRREIPRINGKLPNNMDGNEESLPDDTDFSKAGSEVSVMVIFKSSGEELHYKNIGLPIRYTGGILITGDFINGMYVHMGLQAPVSHRIVIELRFGDGKLIEKNDISDEAQRCRDVNRVAEKIGGKFTRPNQSKWYADVFNLGKWRSSNRESTIGDSIKV